MNFVQRHGFGKVGQAARKIVALPLFWYVLLALAIMVPLLHPGFVLTLDMVFTPEIRLPKQVGSSYAFYGLLHVLNIALPADFLQKLVLMATFTMAGLGVHKLLQYVEHGGRLGQAAPYLAGLFYVVNPFTYERFLTGQYAVLMGYALMPWFLRSLLRMLAQPGWRRMAALAVWTTVLAILSIHSIVPAVLLAVLAVAVQLWRLRGRYSKQWQVVYFCALTSLFWVAANCYWLAPLAAGQSQTAQTIESFTAGDRQAFATTGDGLAERIGNVLALQGFWGERYKLFVGVQEYVPGWSALMIVLVLLATVGGAVVMWRWKQRGLLVVLAVAGSIAAVVASGFGNGWLAAHVPLFAGYREPQKFAVLVALAYAVGLAFGSAGLMRLIRKNSRLPITAPALWAALFALPVLTASALFWGARGQLHAIQYPDGWAMANRQLNRDNNNGENFQSLFLPWHLYIYTDFVGRTIANPAGSYFDKPMIVGNDPELGGAALARSDTTHEQIAAALATAPRDKSGQNLGLLLAQLNVKYIVVAKISDYPLYGYLGRQANITLLSDHDTLLVYRNDAYDELKRGRLYQRSQQDRQDQQQSPAPTY